MMTFRSLIPSSRSHLLRVFCAILALMLDVSPTLVTGLVPLDPTASRGGSSSTPLPEDAEGEETPDEACDLARPILEQVRSQLAGRMVRFAKTVGKGRAEARSHLADAPERDLPILLCRLTC
jgi:hypothetical protein